MGNAPVNLCFATDGNEAQILGICLILHGLRTRLAAQPMKSNVWIAAPQSAHERTAQWLNATGLDVNHRFVRAETRSDDRYFVQLFLIDIFKEVGESDTVTCFDYDHLMLYPESFPFSDSEVIMVSSEIRAIIPSGVLPMFDKQTELAQLNTSFLFGKSSTLLQIGRHWRSAYDELYPLSDRRHLTEIAFGLAALRAGVKVSPCSDSIQGNFVNSNQRCVAFHYGGETPGALRMKLLLNECAETLPPRGPSSNDLDRLTHILQQRLANILETKIDS
jgi:hypothetical protein